MGDAIVTEHGEMRIRKRAGLPKKAAEKLALDALIHGKSKNQFSGSFRRYLDKLWHKSASKPSVRVYNGYIFIFDGNRLVTMFVAPTKYRTMAQTSKKK